MNGRTIHRASALLAAALLALTLSGRATAVEIEGVRLPETVEVAGRTLLLNGAGVRTKFFFDIYVGALYLPERTRDAARAIAMPGPKAVRMVIVYSEVSREKLAHGWRKGFEKNLDAAALAAMKPRLERFIAMFPDMRRGDTAEFEMLPAADHGGGVRVRVGGREAGLIEGEDFARALLSVWLGEHPADEDLKEAMLGR